MACSELEEAQRTCEKILGYTNYLGLDAEELGPRGGHLGHISQTFPYLALISAAHAVHRALSEQGHGAAERQWARSCRPRMAVTGPSASGLKARISGRSAPFR
jgi:hypothetical protein